MALEITQICDDCGRRVTLRGIQLESLTVISDMGTKRVFIDPSFVCHPCVMKVITNAVKGGTLKISGHVS